jgi:hypothetical protein
VEEEQDLRGDEVFDDKVTRALLHSRDSAANGRELKEKPKVYVIG